MKIWNYTISTTEFTLLSLFVSHFPKKEYGTKVLITSCMPPTTLSKGLCHDLVSFYNCRYQMQVTTFFFVTGDAFIYTFLSHGTIYNIHLVLIMHIKNVFSLQWNCIFSALPLNNTNMAIIYVNCLYFKTLCVGNYLYFFKGGIING